jgi:hypothetical protein
MTTFTIKTANGFNTNNELPLNRSQILVKNQTNWTLQDNVTSDKYIFLGSGFTYNNYGVITSGLITQAIQRDSVGNVIATAQFSQVYDVTKLGYPSKYSDLLLGDDLIVGGAGDDTLGGGGASSSITGLFNTGVGLSSDGQIDYNYKFTNLSGTATGFSGYAKVVVGYGFPISSGTWVLDNSISHWLIPTESRMGYYADNGKPGDYRYSLQFDLGSIWIPRSF